LILSDTLQWFIPRSVAESGRWPQQDIRFYFLSFVQPGIIYLNQMLTKAKQIFFAGLFGLAFSLLVWAML